MITEKEIANFWERYKANLDNEKDLVPLAYLFLPIAMLFRVYIRRKYYETEPSILITNLWFLLKDDFKKEDRENGKNNYKWLDYGEQSFRDRFKLFWFIPFKLKKSFFAAWMWLLRNNLWNYKETVAEEENGVYNDVYFDKSRLKKGRNLIPPKIKTWAELMYVEKNDKTPANRGSIFSYEHTVRGEQEVYYRTFGGLVHGRYSRVYTVMMLPFGYQIALEIQKGAGGQWFRYRKKTKLIKCKEKL